MLNSELLMQLVTIAIVLSCVTTAFIQKTKTMFKTSKFIALYSFVINITIGILFSLSFTSANIVQSIWVGFFAFIGADTLYKALEGKLKSFSDSVSEKVIEIDRGE